MEIVSHMVAAHCELCVRLPGIPLPLQVTSAMQLRRDRTMKVRALEKERHGCTHRFLRGRSAMQAQVGVKSMDTSAAHGARTAQEVR
jgi:hypothetical protein